MVKNGKTNIVVIGGGQGAVQAIASLRQFGYEGTITLICDEDVIPYQRPPLSKAYMKGELQREHIFFKPASWYTENTIDVRLSTSANTISRDKKVVTLSTGEQLHYDKLILSTGSRPRKLSLSGATSKNVFYLRTLSDVEKLRMGMKTGCRLLLIGAGYIGLECAAVASQMGVSVTVLEEAERVLSRVTGTIISQHYSNIHKEHGVDIHVCKKLHAFKIEKDKVTHAITKDGTQFETDIIVVGIGALPNEELAVKAGIYCDEGIIVDDDSQTSDPNIFAIGDCSKRPLAIYDRSMRLESVHNAIEQGKLAASAIMERPRPKMDCPWFWSDQYDVKLQIAGISTGYDETVTRGSINQSKFSVFYLHNKRLLAVDAVNNPTDFMIGKKIIMARQLVLSKTLMDESIPLKDILLQDQ